MKKTIALLILAANILLTGCDTRLETELNISDLTGTKPGIVTGSVFVEVASCASYEDSRKPSESVLEAQKIVPEIFKDAAFEECFSRGMDSYARFSIPMALNHAPKNSPVSEKYVTIATTDKMLLKIIIPDTIRSGFDNLKSRSFQFGSLNLEICFTITNDTDKDIPFMIVSAYVDDEPYVFGNLTLKKGSSYKVRLSDVSADSTLHSGSTAVLFR